VGVRNFDSWAKNTSCLAFAKRQYVAKTSVGLGGARLVKIRDELPAAPQSDVGTARANSRLLLGLNVFVALDTCPFEVTAVTYHSGNESNHA
jgi:hypothetical protein